VDSPEERGPRGCHFWKIVFWGVRTKIVSYKRNLMNSSKFMEEKIIWHGGVEN
jgi:hypothetical protein